MRALILGGVAALIASFFATQEQGAPNAGAPSSATTSATVEPAFVAESETHPNPAAFYPPAAITERWSGLTHLCCVARPDRTTRCVVGYEDPVNAGFGDGALSFAKELRLTEASYAALSARSNHEFQIAIRWQADRSTDFDRRAQQVHEQAGDLCGAGSGLAPPYVVATAPPRSAGSSAADFGRYFPPRAIEHNVSGFAYLCCTADQNHALSCRVALEQPLGYGFGDAATRIARSFRLPGDRINSPQASSTQMLSVPMEFHALPLPSDFNATRQRVRDQAHDICGPGTDAQADDGIIITAQRIRR